MELNRIQEPRVNYCTGEMHNRWVSPCYICKTICCRRCHHRKWISSWEFLYFCNLCYDKLQFLNDLG